MLMETIWACFLLACLIVFFSANLHNILLVHKPPAERMITHAEIDQPTGVTLDLVALGTLVYFIEAACYPILVLANLVSLLSIFTFTISRWLVLCGQMLGLLLTTFGYSLFLWSVIARGKYATSWAMPENHRLVTSGPYRYVRHPSYLAYFAMFIGFFAVWPSWLSLIPLVAVPGYYRVTIQEEKLLERRFGKEYLKYQKNTGRFVPKLKTHAEEEQND
jgi:protein-S-isoprenylcysteine O-methyltransferase Ste14